MCPPVPSPYLYPITYPPSADARTYRQTDRHTDRQTHGQTDTRTDRPTDRHTHRHTDPKTDRPTDTHTNRSTQQNKKTPKPKKTNKTNNHLALKAGLVLSEGVEQPVAECGDQARVGAVAQHGGALPRACLAIGQQRGVVALQGALKHPLPQVLEHTRLGEEGDEGDEGEEGSLFLF